MKIPLIAVFIFTNLSYGVLTIEYDFKSSVSEENRVLFNQVKVFWESVITGYSDGIDRTLVIDAGTFRMDVSGGGILGVASPTTVGSMENGLRIATGGVTRFNVDPTAIGEAGLLNELVIRHEVGHILGIGTLWELNGLYDQGSGKYTGANGVAAFNQEFGLNSSFVPIELDGGYGTANAHFNEVADNPFKENATGADSDPGDDGFAPTVVSGPNKGRTLDESLFSGLLSKDMFLTDTAIGSLQDLGFTTVGFTTVGLQSDTPLQSNRLFQANVTSVPEPSVSIFLALGLSTLLVQRKRKC